MVQTSNQSRIRFSISPGLVGSLYFPPVQDNFQTFNPGLVGSLNFQPAQDNFQTFNHGLVGSLYFPPVQDYLVLDW